MMRRDLRFGQKKKILVLLDAKNHNPKTVKSGGVRQKKKKKGVCVCAAAKPEKEHERRGQIEIHTHTHTSRRGRGHVKDECVCVLRDAPSEKK